MRSATIQRTSGLALAFISLGGIPVLGQKPSEQVQSRIEMKPGVVSPSELELAPEVIAAMELGLDFRLIKDRPFRAEMIVETEKKLADGNSIQRTSKATFYRDGLGRMREERTLESRPGIDPQPYDVTVNITDPENSVHYFLYPRMKAGFRVKAPDGIAEVLESRRTTPWTPQRGQKVITEILGYQMIEGLHCEGKLDTVTIPAGTAGNPFPIEVRTERWYSAELQINLLIKRIDPRSGETTIRLINVSREEPAKELFEVPPDYKLNSGGVIQMPPAENDRP